MIQLQEVDAHTDKKVFFKLHLVTPTGVAPFFVEILVYDSEFTPPFQSNVLFHQQFNGSKEAFEHGIRWVLNYSAKHEYAINRVNNPCNCEFLPQPDQQAIVNAAGLGLRVQVNGE